MIAELGFPPVFQTYQYPVSDFSKRSSAILSRPAQSHSDGFQSCAFLVGGFSAGGAFDLDAVNAMTKKVLGTQRWDIENCAMRRMQERSLIVM